MGEQIEKSSLDDIIGGRLPKRIIKSIEEMSITLAEVSEWERTKTRTRILLTKGELLVDIHLRIPTVNLLLILVGAGGVGALISWGAKLLIS